MEDMNMDMELYEGKPLINNAMNTKEEIWSYPMRRKMQEILPGLWLGPYAAAMKSNEKVLMDVGITHMILVRSSMETNFVRINFPELKHLIVELADCPSVDLLQHCREVNHFIDQCLSQGGKILMFSTHGISRGPSLMIAYLMMKKQLTFEEAFQHIQNIRLCVHPSEYFTRQLIQLEHILKTSRFQPSRPPKRPIDEVDMT